MDISLQMFQDNPSPLIRVITSQQGQRTKKYRAHYMKRLKKRKIVDQIKKLTRKKNGWIDIQKS